MERQGGMRCAKCGKKAVGRLSPDLDVKGLGFCRKDKEEVQDAYMILVICCGADGSMKEFKSVTRGWWINGKQGK